ncbi:hypothetical protein VTH06DRAFT_7285 [Thermothelomyces fergusii]
MARYTSAQSLQVLIQSYHDQMHEQQIEFNAESVIFFFAFVPEHQAPLQQPQLSPTEWFGLAGATQIC